MDATAQLRARNRQQTSLAALGLTAIRAVDLTPLLDEAAAVVASTLDTEYSAIAEVLPDSDEFLMRAGVGWRPGLVGRAGSGAGTPAGYLLRSGEPVVIADARTESRFPLPMPMREHGVTSAAYVIIRGRARLWGVVSAYTTRQRRFDADDVSFLQSVANVLALAVERHELEVSQRREKEILQAVFDNIPVMVSFYEASGRLLRVNQEWERTLGWTFAEAQSVDLMAEAYPDPEARREAFEFIRRSERRWADFRTRTRDGRVLDTSWARLELSDGSRIGFGLDLTERKRAQAERDRLLESETQARNQAEAALERVRAMQAITDRALVHLGVDDLLRELLTRLRQALNAESAIVMFPEENSEHLYPRAWDGEFHADIASVRVRLGKGVSGRIVAEGRPLIVDDVRSIDPSGVSGLFHPGGLASPRSVMGAPLEVGGKVVGAVLVASRHPRRFSEDDLSLMRLVADRVGPAMERARLTEQARAAHERLEALSRRLLTAQEEERRRLAVELHDELGQVLTAVKINLESLARSSSGATPAALENAIGSVDRAMHSVRDLAFNLRPSVLDDLGLPAALRWYADRFGRDIEVEVHVSVDAVPDLEPEIATACFRVAQEALTNVARHAQATNVWLDLRLIAEGLELRVRDDGLGLNAEAARQRATQGASMGLLGMQERVSLVGGELELRAPIEGGTEVRARFPIGATPGKPA